MLRHTWWQGAFLGSLFLVWMLWHGRSPRKQRRRPADTAAGANSKEVS